MTNADKRFEEIGRRWIHDSTELKPSEIPDVVYHYTNAAGLEGALRSGKLWLTDFRFLNDSAEFTHAKQIMSQVLTDRLTETGPGIPALYKHALHHAKTHKGSFGYVFSLTTERDDLSQWRGYANEGSGFTIGLSGQRLYETAKTEFNFSRVQYNEANEQRAIELALKEMELELAEQCKNSVENEEETLARDAGINFAWLAANRASFNKHPSFRGENEWRVVTYRSPGSDQIKVRVSGDRLVPYLEVSCDANDKLPLVSIGIGPGFAGSEVVDAVRALAKSHGYAPEIYFANTPFRRT